MNTDFYGSMNRFFNEVRTIFQEAQQKGYSRGAEGDGRDLLDFIKTHFGNHATGEAVYKLVRFQKKGDPKDLLKAAAWIFLIWDQQRRQDKPFDIPTMTATQAMDAQYTGPANIPVATVDAQEHRYSSATRSTAEVELNAHQRQMVGILEEIANEAERAELVHKPMSDQTQLRRLKVLRAEVAEAENEVINIQGVKDQIFSKRMAPQARLRVELVQIAAVCANWIKNLPKGPLNGR